MLLYLVYLYGRAICSNLARARVELEGFLIVGIHPRNKEKYLSDPLYARVKQGIFVVGDKYFDLINFFETIGATRIETRCCF